MKKPRVKPFDFQQIMDDTPENRETMFQGMLLYDEPYRQPGMKRDGLTFFLVVNRRSKKLQFMTGFDVKDSAEFIIVQWSPRSGLRLVDLPIHEIRWVNHL